MVAKLREFIDILKILRNPTNPGFLVNTIFKECIGKTCSSCDNGDIISAEMCLSCNNRKGSRTDEDS